MYEPLEGFGYGHHRQATRQGFSRSSLSREDRSFLSHADTAHAMYSSLDDRFSHLRRLMGVRFSAGDNH